MPILSANARYVLKSRYLRRDLSGRSIETPDQLFERTAHAVAFAETLLGNNGQAGYWEEQFHSLVTSLDFLPNSPTLMNAGAPHGQLSACFVLPIDDTIEEIFESMKQMTLIARTGGGVGFSFSRLRPKGSILTSSGGAASGPVSFMKIFNAATENIRQGGRRRGANMGVLRVDHPDILEFIRAKADGKSFKNFNLSVAVTDSFMEAVRNDICFPLVDHRPGKTVREVMAREVFSAIVEAAWRSGDPGLLFIDSINRANPTPDLGVIEATNPCGEVPLLPFESCNLGSVNLSHMVMGHRDDGMINWEKLRVTVGKAVRFLDNVIQINRYPFQDIERMTNATRKIGLGVMGFAELLVKLGIPYGSADCITCGERIMQVIRDEALKASRRLAEERGVFPQWEASVYHDRGIKVRNATQTAIAPTGTISIIAGTSNSIEPLFALAYRRTNVLDGQTLYEFNPLFLEYADRHGIRSADLAEQVREKGQLGEIEGISPEVRRLFATALGISPEEHLSVQAAFQRHVDNSVSKTINLPFEATLSDVAGIYQRAWELNLKGITVYRYGSRAAQVLELGADEQPYHYEHASKCDPGECRVE